MSAPVSLSPFLRLNGPENIPTTDGGAVEFAARVGRPRSNTAISGDARREQSLVRRVYSTTLHDRLNALQAAPQTQPGLRAAAQTRLRKAATKLQSVARNAAGNMRTAGLVAAAPIWAPIALYKIAKSYAPR